MLNNKEKELLIMFLDEFGDRLSNDGCNDWAFPEDWTVEERDQFKKEYISFNENIPLSDITNEMLKEYGRHMANTSVVYTLRKKLELETNNG